MEDYKIPAIHKHYLNILLHDVTKILDYYQIQYWADGGTMLGCMREGGQIDHDDDCDLGVMADDMPKVFQLFPVFKEIGLLVTYLDDIVKIYLPHMHVNHDGREVKTPTIDIFAYKQKNDMIVLDSVTHRKVWKNARHHVKDLFPLVKRKFDDIEIWSPSNPMPYLLGLYGDDCMTKKKIYLKDIDTNQ